MDKLKKALSGDDGDEEQGIVTQVLNEEFIYSLMRQWSYIYICVSFTSRPQALVAWNSPGFYGTAVLNV